MVSSNRLNQSGVLAKDIPVLGDCRHADQSYESESHEALVQELMQTHRQGQEDILRAT